MSYGQEIENTDFANNAMPNWTYDDGTLAEEAPYKKEKKKIMAPRKNNKPLLVAVGNHLIDPTDVACISKVKNGKLFVVNLKSQPNKEYPIWVKPHEISGLLSHLNIAGDLSSGDDD